MEDLVGRRFDKLLVLSYAGPAKRWQHRWLCQCDCGKTSEVQGGNLKSRNTKSCGCDRVHVTRANKTTHGCAVHGRQSAEYRIWCGIKERCYRSQSKSYADYGARGITMSTAWSESFEQFLHDMGPRPTKKHSIERRNNDGNYECGNCIWATAKQQAANRRPRSDTRWVDHNGQLVPAATKARLCGIPVSTLYARLTRSESQVSAP